MDGVWNEEVATILVDAGDLFGRREVMDQEQTRFVCDVTESFGYDAIGLGEMDLNYGTEFLFEMIEKHNLPFICSNVKDPDSGELLLRPYVVVERGGTRFGICSVLDPLQKIQTMAAQDPHFEVEDPVVTLRNLIPKMREEVDTIILLAHMGDRLAEDLLKEVSGVDVAVVGHSYRSFNSERVIGETVFLCAVYEGRYIGRANLNVDGDGIVQTFTVDVTSLDQEIGDDPVMLERIKNFKENLQEFRLSLRGDHQPVKGSDKEQFLTERVCQKCHADTWEIVKSHKHQTALSALRKKGQGFNPDCLVCHVVGYEYQNGYDDIPPLNKLTNVQCEACHGYGTEHNRDGSMLKMAREACVTCHDEKNSPNFSYASYWEQIKH
ncbi:MAG: multiheme c-type cytochrome [bacterium]